MRWLLIIVLLVVLLTFRSEAERKQCSKAHGVNETRKNYSNQALVSVTVNNECDLKYLQKMVKESVVELWNEAINGKILMRVPMIQLNFIQSLLNNKNMPFTVVTRDLQMLLRRESEEFQPSRGKLMTDSSDSKDFFNTYHSVEEITKFLKSFTRENADVCKLEVIGYSFEQRPLFAVKISVNSRRRKSGKQGNSKKMILIDCGTHAREWPTISFCLYFMDKLVTDYRQRDANMQKILKKYDFTIIPLINPDGYKYSQTVDRLWRKNRSKNNESDCIGVDLNRNFDTAFQKCEASRACGEDYCGPTAFSEPETRSLKRLLQKNKGRIKAYFTMHTYSQLWFLPWAKTSETKPENYDDMVNIANIGAEAIKKRHGAVFTVGMPSLLLYSTGGTSMDYVYEKGFAEFSYALELRDKGEFGFLLPKDQLPLLNEETTDGVLAAISAMK